MDSLSPVISKVSLQYDKSMVESIVPNPERTPYILKNEVLNFYITFKGQLDKEAKFNFSYEDSKNKLPYASEITVDPEMTSEPYVDKMAHYKVIKNLELAAKQGTKLEDEMFYVKVVDHQAEAIKYSVKHQILSEYTAFICVGK